jgi:glycosyltransferase involved in cell wall biosynthesis
MSHPATSVETHSFVSPEEPFLDVGLIAQFPPLTGGVPVFAAWLLENAAKTGARYCPFALEPPAAGRSSGQLTAASLATQARNLRRFLVWLRGAPRLVHICVAGNPTGLARDLMLLALLRASGRRAIAHVHHAADLERARRSLIYRVALRLVGRLSAETVALAPTAAAWLASAGVRAQVVSSPVRIERGGPRPSRRDARLQVAFVGGLSEAKGCFDLAAATAAARSSGADVRVTYAGEERRPGESVLLQRECARLGIGDVVKFLGHLPVAELRRLYLDVDAVCLPSYREGLPLVVLEAMAMGLPVIASSVGAVPDVVVDGVTGLLVRPGDVEALRSALCTLAADPGRAAALGEAGRTRVAESDSVTAIAGRWREVYREVASR